MYSTWLELLAGPKLWSTCYMCNCVMCSDHRLLSLDASRVLKAILYRKVSLRDGLRVDIGAEVDVLVPVALEAR